jgi:hypothetical protein
LVESTGCVQLGAVAIVIVSLEVFWLKIAYELMGIAWKLVTVYIKVGMVSLGRARSDEIYLVRRA